MSRIADGFLAGMKIRALDEELKRAKLERVEFEETRSHRDRMRLLQEQAVMAETNLRGIQSQATEFQKMALQEELGQSKELHPIKVQQAKADVAGRKQDTRSSKALTGESKSRTKKNEVETTQTMLQNVLLQQGIQSGVGAGALELQESDFATLAATSMEASGVKFQPGDAAHQMWTHGIRGQAEQKRQERDLIVAQNDHNRQSAKVEMIAGIIDKASGAADPEGMAEFLAKEMFPDEPELIGPIKTSAASRRKAYLDAQEAKTPEAREPREDEYTKGIREAIAAAQASAAGLRSMDKLTSKEKKQLDANDKKAKELQGRLKEYFEGTKSLTASKATTKTPAEWVAEVRGDPKFTNASPKEVADEAKRRAGMR